MAVISITDAVIKMDSTEGGSLTDYSSEIISGVLETTRTNTPHYTFGSPAAKVSVGRYTGTLRFVVEANTGASSLHGVISTMALDGSPTARSFEVYEPSTAAGSHKYAFEAYSVGYPLLNSDAGGSGVATHEATFAIYGEITYTVVT